VVSIYRERVLFPADSRLKRQIHWDDRSWDYRLDTAGLTIVDVQHLRSIGTLDQGKAGKCTAETAIGVLATDTIAAALPKRVPYTLDDAGSDVFYNDEETLDGDGPWRPQDNGSSGLTAAKVMWSHGLISGYRHTFTPDDALKALGLGPIMVGVPWFQSMFTPDGHGRVRVQPRTGLAGYHEVEGYQVAVTGEQVWFYQSWGRWGVDPVTHSPAGTGAFYVTWDDLAVLLAAKGDVTIPLPLTVPAPTPPADPDATFAAALRPWLPLRHTGRNAVVAAAAKVWLDANGQ
jgi:hypothetical protein